MPFELNKNFSSEFSLDPSGIYLNCAAQGPLPKVASQAVLQGLKDKENPAVMDQNYSLIKSQKMRQAVSRLIQCEPSQVAMANSTGWGINILAQGLRLKSGDEVLAYRGQFPSNAAPWELLMENGVKFNRIPTEDDLFDLDVFKKSITSKTRIATVEWVHYVSGDRIPLADVVDICHKKNVLVVVDVTQGLGAIPFSMKEMGVDAVVGSGYKWLLSPYGSGFLALTNELMQKLSTPILNWQTLNSDWTGDLGDYKIEFDKTARRFDVQSFMGFLTIDGMIKSVEWLLEKTPEKLWQMAKPLADQLLEEMNPKYFRRLNPNSGERQSLITTFEMQNVDVDMLVKSFTTEKITVSIRNGCLRVSPFIYNDHEQISRFTEVANTVASH